MMTRTRAHPLVLVALAALCLLSARLLVAQESVPAPTRRVAVATRLIPRGSVLTADDFQMRDSTLRGFVGVLDTATVKPGWMARRTINAGEILREPAVEAPTVVTANDPVQVEFADRNVTLVVRGIAARSGAIGDRVPVRTALGKRLEATIIARGRVRID